MTIVAPASDKGKTSRKQTKQNEEAGKGGNPSKSNPSSPSTQPPVGGGKGSAKNANGGGKSDQPPSATPTSSQKTPCFFFHSEKGCSFGDKCHFDHSPISEVAKKNLQRPTSRARESNVDKPPAANRRPSARASRNITHCWAFVKGDCKDGENCKFRHLTQKQLDEQIAAN